MNTPREVWTYYISRNSENGVPDELFDVWWIHPLRVDHGCCVMWEAADQANPGYFQKYTRAQLEAEHVTLPDNDRELIVCERWATDPNEKVQPKKKRR